MTKKKSETKAKAKASSKKAKKVISNKKLSRIATMKDFLRIGASDKVIEKEFLQFYKKKNPDVEKAFVLKRIGIYKKIAQKEIDKEA